MRYVISSLSLCLLLLSSGCSLTKLAAEQTVDVLTLGATSFYEETDYELATGAVAANLKTMEAISVVANDNPSLFATLARGFCSYTYGWIETKIMGREEDPFDPEQIHLDKRAIHLYRRGKAYGLRALNLVHPGFATGITGTGREKWLGKLGKKDSDALFWTSYCWAGEIQHRIDDPDALGELPTIRALLKRSLAIDPEEYWGVANILLGAIESALPASLGGDVPKAQLLFDKGLAVSHRRYLLGLVAQAQTLAVNTGNRELFRKSLEEVLAADDTILPEENLSNQIAKIQAKELLARLDELF